MILVYVTADLNIKNVVVLTKSSPLKIIMYAFLLLGVVINCKRKADKPYNKSRDTIVSSKSSKHKKRNRNPNYKTFGWHLPSNDNLYKNYNFSMLWGLSYFSYTIKPETGSYKSIHQWKTTSLIDSAKVHNCKVFLSVSNFGTKNNTVFLNNSKAQETLIKNLVELLAYRKADGINIDFEGISKKDKNLFTNFISKVSKQLKKENPNYLISLCLYANDWHHIFDIKKLNSSIDFYTLMGYDYYGDFSTETGPISPLKNTQKFGNGLEHSVNYYLKQGIVSNKLIVGLPYYGVEWYTKSEKVPAKVLKYKSNPTYSTIKRLYIDSLKIPVHFDNKSGASYLSFKKEGAYRQIWFENTESLSQKYDWIQQNKLGGVGIWALGYDNGYSTLWNLLTEKFSEQKKP